MSGGLVNLAIETACGSRACLTFIDTYTQVALAKLYDRKRPITAAIF
jgi:hypothetical protein